MKNNNLWQFFVDRLRIVAIALSFIGGMAAAISFSENNKRLLLARYKRLAHKVKLDVFPKHIGSREKHC